MVMKNGSKTVPGSYNAKIYNWDGSLQSDSTQLVSTRERLTLGSVGSTVGDMVNPNPHQYVSTYRIYWNGSTRTYYSDGRPRGVYFGVIPGKVLAENHPNDFAFSTSAYNSALGDLAEQVRGSLDLSIDMAQWKMVRDMINIRKRGIEGLAKTLGSIAYGIDTLDRNSRRRVRRRRNGRRPGRDIRFDDSTEWYQKRARKLAEWAASKRLEYVYGWQPLARTLVDLGKEFCDPKEPPVINLVARGFDRNRFVNDVASSEKRSYNVSYRCEIEAVFGPSANSMVDLLSRITSLNPASIVWELTPFSFVVDWFVDIGGWLRSTETAMTHGNRFIKGRISQSYRSIGTYEDGLNTKTEQRLHKAYTKKVCFKRSLLGSYPLPKMPTFNPSIGDSRKLTAAALLMVNARRIDAFITRWR